MGRSGSGKTSMRSIIFANFMARDTGRLNPTMEVENTHVRFLGNLVLSLWDCGGQFSFYESYFDSQRKHIFGGVEVLIYVFDVESPDEEQDLELFCHVLEALEEHSRDAKIFVLVHKMDLIMESERSEVFDAKKRLIGRSILEYMQTFAQNQGSEGLQDRDGQLVTLEDEISAPEVQRLLDSCLHSSIQFFATSIWDETLYKAWSTMVYSLIPNAEIIRSNLHDFCEVCDAEEVVLFERESFLIISHVSRSEEELGAPNDAVVSSSSSSGSDGGDAEQEPSPAPEVSTASDSESQEEAAGQEEEEEEAWGDRRAPVVYDEHRFERISNIIKQFKLSCMKTNDHFVGLEIQNKQFLCILSLVTSNTFVMVVVSDVDRVKAPLIYHNIERSKEHFDTLLQQTS